MYSFRARIVTWSLALVVALGSWINAPAAVYNTSVNGYQFSLLIIDNPTMTLRGVFFHLLGAGGTTAFTNITNPSLSRMLTDTRFAYMGTNATLNGSFSYSGTVYAAIIAALDTFAVKSNHPELHQAPVFSEGFSAGGMISFHFALHYPDRTVGFVQDKGGYADNTTRDVAVGVPGVFVTGTAEPSSYAGNNPLIVKNHRAAYGARWSMWMEPNAGHGPVAPTHVWNFFKAIVDRRVPQTVTIGQAVKLMPIAESSGWLGSNSADCTIGAFACYTADKGTASWLPTDSLAREWQSFVSSNTITRTVTCATGVEKHTAAQSVATGQALSRNALLMLGPDSRRPACGTTYRLDGRIAPLSAHQDVTIRVQSLGAK